MDLRNCLQELCDAAGIGGVREAADVAVKWLTPLTDAVWCDALGNVCARRACADENAPTVMLEAHIDDIGLIVTAIDERGFIRVDACGGVDARTLQATPVVVYGTRPVDGVIISTPPHLADKDKGLPAVSDLAVDVGMTKEQAEECIRIGDRIGFAPRFVPLSDHRVCSKSLDNRAGVAAILHALHRTKDVPLPVHIAVCFAVQEELGCRGAKAAANALQPDAALVTDVSFALTPAIQSKPHECGILGKGAMLCIAATLDGALTHQLETLAKERDIPLQYEPISGKTGTDADVISIAGKGVRCALISIPLRYMHTPAEVADMRDIEAVGDLMAAALIKGV